MENINPHLFYHKHVLSFLYFFINMYCLSCYKSDCTTIGFIDKDVKNIVGKYNKKAKYVKG